MRVVISVEVVDGMLAVRPAVEAALVKIESGSLTGALDAESMSYSYEVRLEPASNDGVFTDSIPVTLHY